MKRVTGVGGIFFKSADPKRLAAWYQQHLGLDLAEWGGAIFRWGGEGGPPGTTVWSPADAGTDLLQPGTSTFMVNFRVDDLDALRAALTREGCRVLEETQSGELGKFGWVIDPEGNKVELWEPPPGR